ncbi:MAG TPA: hypothetical protein VNL15_04490, partial [Dehalococcoidia bacterium]|nr:hypothetical protein [Dehalococcoidia bacterium]
MAWRVWRAIRLFLEQNRLGALPSLLLGTAGFLALTLPLLLGALLLEEPGLLAWALLVTVLVLLFVFTMVTFQRPAVFITVFVLWFALQRVLVAVVAPEVDADMVRLLLVYKEGFYLVLPAAGVAYLTVRYLTGQGRFTSILLADVLAVLFLALLAVSFLASDVDFTPRLTYLRRFAAPVFLYLGGRLLLPGESQLREGLRIALLVILAVALFGLVERFLLDISFWRNVVDAEAFYSQQVEAGLIPESWLFIYRGVPDGVFIALPLSVPVRRLVSTFLEPTTLGAFLAFGLLLFLLAPAASGLRPGKLTALAAILATLAITATLSRGAMLLVVSAAVLFLAVVFLRERKPQQLLRYGTWSPVLALLAVGIVITTF